MQVHSHSWLFNIANMGMGLHGDEATKKFNVHTYVHVHVYAKTSVPTLTDTSRKKGDTRERGRGSACRTTPVARQRLEGKHWSSMAAPFVALVSDKLSKNQRKTTTDTQITHHPIVCGFSHLV